MRMQSSSKIAIASLSTLGAIETGYLTYSKVTSIPVLSDLCSSNAVTSCNDVLTGPYSNLPIGNVPISALAFASYLAIAILSFSSGSTNRSTNSSDKSSEGVDFYILFATAAMGTFSIYLLSLLSFVLHSQCNYCYASAAISISMALVAWKSKVVPNQSKAFAITSMSVAITAFASAFLFYLTNVTVVQAVDARVAVGKEAAEDDEAVRILQSMASKQKEESLVKRPQAITKHSSELALQVAQKLKQLNAKMYGAYWCSHCFNQKQNLGVEAKEYFEYVECDREGLNTQYDMCKKNKNVPGFPTWEIGGKYFPGEKSVAELDELLRTEVF